MNRSTRIALNALNASFYATRAEEFSASRAHRWPGWERVWHAVLERRSRAPNPDRGECGESAPALRVLDVGCGNGRLAHFLSDRCARTGVALDYLGLDACEPLVTIARQALRTRPASPGRGIAALRFERADLVERPPAEALPAGSFDLVTAFGLLHHLPGLATRRALVRALGERVAPGGVLALAFWRFAELERFRRRMIDWRELASALPQVPGCSAIDPGQLEGGDHLLRWGEPGSRSSLRYCHFSDAQERETLLANLPLERIDEFCADGRERNLNHHVLLARAHV